MLTTQPATEEVEYPEEDDAVSESNKHYIEGARLVDTLLLYYQDRPDVFVGGNSFVYYQQGDPSKVFSPDAYVVFGVQPRPLDERASWFIWQEGVAPTVIFELASKSTVRQDRTSKLHLYAR